MVIFHISAAITFPFRTLNHICDYTDIRSSDAQYLSGQGTLSTHCPFVSRKYTSSPATANS